MISTQLIFMASNQQAIERIVKEFMHTNAISHISTGPAVLHSSGDKASIHKFDYWIVPYVYKVFQEEDAFVYINDASQKIMYVLTKHGKTHIDGQRKPVENEDEESWDDL